MKISHNRAWWCGLTLPLLSACGCQSKTTSDTAETLIVPAPHTTLARLGGPYVGSPPVYWSRDRFATSTTRLKISVKTARKLEQVETLLDYKTKRQIASLTTLSIASGIRLQADLVYALDSGGISSEQAANALRQLADSASKLMQALLVRVEIVGSTDPKLKLQSDKLLRARAQYSGEGDLNGSFMPYLLLESSSFAKAVKTAGFPNKQIDLAAIIQSDVRISIDVDQAIGRYLATQAHSEAIIRAFAADHPSLRTQLNKFLLDPSSPPKYSLASFLLESYFELPRDSDKVDNNNLIILGDAFKSLQGQSDLDQARVVTLGCELLFRLNMHLNLSAEQIQRYSTSLFSVEAAEAYRLSFAQTGLNRFLGLQVIGAQSNFNSLIMPLIEYLRESNQPMKNLAVEDLYRSLRSHLLPNDYWPSNVRVLASSGIAYNDWEMSQKLIDSIQDEVTARRDQYDTGGTLIRVFQKHFPYVRTAWSMPANTGAVASANFKDVQVANRNDLDVAPLRVLFIAGRDFRTNATAQGEGFLNFANSLNSVFRGLPYTTTDTIFASSAGGVCDLLGNLGMTKRENDYYPSKEKREELIIMLFGLGHSGPQLGTSSNVGEMFDGSVILDKDDNSNLDEYSLKRSLQSSAGRFKSITLVVFSDAGGAFIK